jgi:hypothetical protein
MISVVPLSNLIRLQYCKNTNIGRQFSSLGLISIQASVSRCQVISTTMSRASLSQFSLSGIRSASVAIRKLNIGYEPWKSRSRNSFSTKPSSSSQVTGTKSASKLTVGSADTVTSTINSETTFWQRFIGPKPMPERHTASWYREMLLICTVFAITGSSTMLVGLIICDFYLVVCVSPFSNDPILELPISRICPFLRGNIRSSDPQSVMGWE